MSRLDRHHPKVHDGVNTLHMRLSINDIGHHRASCLRCSRYPSREIYDTLPKGNDGVYPTINRSLFS